ncbi:MAG: thermonuclease family protein [Phycisphaerales bacterium]|nr:MAG: thermonuclease family protein [Phycisphaerales bacterium]
MSRRRRTGLILLCLLSLALVVLFDNSLARRRRRWRSVSGEQTNLADHADYHGKKFVVKNVVDGDTIDIEVSDSRREHTRIRLLGVDAPETGGKNSAAMHYAYEAAAFTRQATLGKSVTIYLDSPGPTRGKYGRLLAYVKLPDGQFLNEVLLTRGYAYADLRFSHSLFNKYLQLSETARRHEKGLWLAVTHEQLPRWLRSKNPDLLRGK